MSAIATDRRRARRSRLLARTPRIALVATATALSVAGLRAAVAGPALVSSSRPVTAAPDLAAEALAQRFARAYLATDPANPDARTRALDAVVPNAADADLDSDPGARRVDVRWTAAVADRWVDGGRLVTVAAATSSGMIHLAVQVERDRRGWLRLGAPPAIVGPPPVARAALEPTGGADVEDSELRAVVERVVRNYVAGERRNLAADLSPAAVVSLPERPLAVDSIDRTFWATHARRVALDLRARDEITGAHYVLRYQLAVRQRGGRWQVSAVEGIPTSKQPGGS